MGDRHLLDDLAPVADRLLQRHLSAAKEWFPHELVPWDRGRRYRPGATFDESGLTPGARSALVLNVLTEDNLPFYLAGLHRQFGEGGPWWDWVRRWTAEEMRHAMVLRDYLSVTGAVDLVALERARMQHVSAACVPAAPTAAEAFVYLALQELATRIAHANTARALADEDGRRLVSRVAADESLHHVFYRDLVDAAIGRDPNEMAVAVDAQVRHFVMPGTAIPGFAEHARVVAEAGIYSAGILLEQVLVPSVIESWGLDRLTGLSAPAARARDRTLDFLGRLERVARRLSSATSAPLGDDGARPDSS